MKFLFIFFLFPLQLFAQDISGVWVGTLYNDTTKEYIHYELAINDDNGKLDGYSHITFVFDNIKNVGVKSVKIKKKKDEFFVEDDKLIYNNYSEPPAKGVRTFSHLTLSKNDSAEVLSGQWNTNQTKIYSALTGTVFLQKKKKIRETLIVKKLDEMGLSNGLSFMTSTPLPNQLAKNSVTEKPTKENTGIAVTTNKINSQLKPETVLEEPKTIAVINPHRKEIEKTKIPEKLLTDLAEKINEKDRALTTQKIRTQIKSEIVLQEPKTMAVINPHHGKIEKTKIPEKLLADLAEKIDAENRALATQKISTQLKPEIVIQEPKTMAVINPHVKGIEKTKIPEQVIVALAKKIYEEQNREFAAQQKTVQPKPETIIKEPKVTAVIIPDQKKEVAVIIPKSPPQPKSETVTPRQKSTPVPNSQPQVALNQNIIKQEAPVIPAAANIASREIETIQTVEILQDSIVLSLFDNGIVDGDTVSVLLNGRVIWPRVGLLVKASNKTIYLTPDMGDSIKIVMYAENLGSLPPNTGLLVIRDGGIDHEVRFSGDLQKNSAIILKRKKKN
ncbi:MAG: hypothetical protein Q8891_02435 [Bacteroidota bacterium]|nr:hypothetical protein [Bacteroidota bacterium]